MWIHPFNIFGQVGENKYTTELFSFSNPLYWEKEAYISIGIAVLLIVFFLIPLKNNSGAWFMRTVNKLGLGYPVLLALFFYLSLTAYRNIPFFIILAMPVFVWVVDSFIRSIIARLNMNFSYRRVYRQRIVIKRKALDRLGPAA